MKSKLPDEAVEATAAQRQLALERDGGNAEDWCELGECYSALASSSPDEESAIVLREKAVAALTRAIALRPGSGKAHFALANVYRAQDTRLALLEFEAAAKCDPAYAAALADAEAHVRNSTHTLGDLHCTVLESAQEKPRSEILGSEFFFEDGPIRSAIVHTCVSKGAGQFAKAWLFELPESTRDTAQPLAEVAISSSGSVSVTRLRAKAPEAAAVPNVTPSPATARARGKSVISAPLTMLLIALGGTFFAYRILVAPPDTRRNEHVVRKAPSATPPREAVTDVARAVKASPKVAASTVSVTPPSAQSKAVAPAPAHPQTAAPDVAKTPSAQQPQKAHIARAATASEAHVRPPVGATATGSTHTPSVERSLPMRSAEAPVASPTTAATPPPSERTEATAQSPSAAAPVTVARRADIASPSASGARNEQVAVAPAPARRPSRSAPQAAVWLTQLRSALSACGRPGLLMNDVCREAARWKHCHPNHWDTVRECAVQRFAASAASN